MDEPCQAGSWWRGGGGCVFSKPVLERRQSAHHRKATPHGRLVRVSKAQLSMRLSIQYPVPTHMSWHWWGWWPTRGPSRERDGTETGETRKGRPYRQTKPTSQTSRGRGTPAMEKRPESSPIQERKDRCAERVGEGEEVEVGKESTFENGGEASLCPTMHLASVSPV